MTGGGRRRWGWQPHPHRPAPFFPGGRGAGTSDERGGGSRRRTPAPVVAPPAAAAVAAAYCDAATDRADRRRPLGDAAPDRSVPPCTHPPAPQTMAVASTK